MDIEDSALKEELDKRIKSAVAMAEIAVLQSKDTLRPRRDISGLTLEFDHTNLYITIGNELLRAIKSYISNLLNLQNSYIRPTGEVVLSPKVRDDMLRLLDCSDIRDAYGEDARVLDTGTYSIIQAFVSKHLECLSENK